MKAPPETFAMESCAFQIPLNCAQSQNLLSLEQNIPLCCSACWRINVSSFLLLDRHTF